MSAPVNKNIVSQAFELACELVNRKVDLGLEMICLVYSTSKHRVTYDTEPEETLCFGELDEKNYSRLEAICRKTTATFVRRPSSSADPDSDSSWNMRNPDYEIFGGTIRASYFLVSCASDNEFASEAVALLMATKLCWLSLQRAKEIATLSDNRLYLDNFASN